MAPAVEDHFIRRNFFQFQGGRTGNELKGRARRIFTGNDPVFHRMVGVIIDHGPFFFRNAPRKPVGVIGRSAGHGQNGPRIGVNGNGGYAVSTDAVGNLAVHGLFRRFL